MTDRAAPPARRRIRAGLVVACAWAAAMVGAPWPSPGGDVARPIPGVALAQSATRLLLDRGDSRIEIVNRGRAADGARSILDLAGCVPDEEVRSSFFYAPEGGATTRIAQAEGGTPAVVTAPLVSVLRPERAESDQEDGASSAEDETIEARDVAASFGRPPCLEEVEEAANPAVRLEQGRTTATGGRFRLDEGSRVATMEGPVSLTREAQGEGARVEASADGLRFDLDDERATLTGNVEIQAGSRVSEADELELDEAAGLAILRGDPAVSRDGSDEVRGSRLRYDLETNDVVVEGSVSASFELAEEDEDGADGVSGPDGSSPEGTSP